MQWCKQKMYNFHASLRIVTFIACANVTQAGSGARRVRCGIQTLCKQRIWFVTSSKPRSMDQETERTSPCTRRYIAAWA